MTLWKLEVVRLVRTHRWVLLLGVYTFFGVIGPVTARYMAQIFERFGGDEFVITVGDPTPADGIVQFIGNAAQLGLLAVVVVAAGALALDAKPERAAFLRTRVPRPSALVMPRYTVTTIAAAGSLVAGTATAWIVTAALIGNLPAGAMVAGTLYGVVFLAFAVALVAFVAGHTKSLVTTIFGALAVLLLMPAVGMVEAIGRWLPTTLLTAVASMVTDGTAGDHVGAAVVSVAATAGLLLLAVRRAGTREL